MGRDGPEVWKRKYLDFEYKQRIHSDFKIARYSSGKGSNFEFWINLFFLDDLGFENYTKLQNKHDLLDFDLKIRSGQVCTDWSCTKLEPLYHLL